MNRHSLPLVFLAVALLVPAAALAKGPSAAAISGPGLGKTITVSGNGETAGTALGQLTLAVGFFPAAFGQEPDPMLSARPHGRLGPRYTIRYVVPGPNSATFHIAQDVYPYAAGGAVAYMRPGQKIFDMATRGGWFRGGSALKQALVRNGLPARAPATSSSNPSLALLVGGPIALLLGGGAAALVARRRRR